MMGGVLFRCDGGQVWGLSLGHVFRCLALADELSMLGVPCRFLMREFPEGVSLVRKRQYQVQTLPFDATNEDGQAACEQAPELLLVFDGPWIGRIDFAALAKAGKTTVVLDDIGGHALEADMVVNAAIPANRHCYPATRRNVRYLLGPAYAILSSEFDAPQHLETGIAQKRILLTFGGADPADLTGRVCAMLADLDSQEVIDVVIGPANGKIPARLPGRACLHHAPPSLAQLMSRCCFAICAAGRTAYEFGVFGKPMLLVPSQSFENETAETLAQCGAALTTGPSDQLEWALRFSVNFARLHDPDCRMLLSKTCHRLFKADGRKRVAREVLCMTNQR